MHPQTQGVEARKEKGLRDKRRREMGGQVRQVVQGRPREKRWRRLDTHENPSERPESRM